MTINIDINIVLVKVCFAIESVTDTAQFFNVLGAGVNSAARPNGEQAKITA